MTMKYYGLYRGVVTNNIDPEEKHRVQIEIPALSSDSNVFPNWAIMCLPPGFITTPKLDEYVWVQFENGDPTLPVCIGVLNNDCCVPN